MNILLQIVSDRLPLGSVIRAGFGSLASRAVLACQLRWVAVKAKTQRVLARYLMHTICVPCLGMVLLFHMRTQVLRPQLAH